MMRFIFLASRLAFVRPIAEVFYFVTCTSVLNLKTLTLPDGLNQNTLECRAPNDAKKKNVPGDEQMPKIQLNWTGEKSLPNIFFNKLPSVFSNLFDGF